MTLPVRASLAWCLILVCAILNGAVRQGLLIPRLGEEAGHVTSTLLLSAIVFLAAWLTWPWVHPADMTAAWSVGALWLLLTLAFEFLAGHYLFHAPWEKLLADYNVVRGRIWILVLLVTFLAPAVVQRVRMM